MRLHHGVVSPSNGVRSFKDFCDFHFCLAASLSRSGRAGLKDRSGLRYGTSERAWLQPRGICVHYWPRRLHHHRRQQPAARLSVEAILLTHINKDPLHSCSLVAPLSYPVLKRR